MVVVRAKKKKKKKKTQKKRNHFTVISLPTLQCMVVGREKKKKKKKNARKQRAHFSFERCDVCPACRAVANAFGLHFATAACCYPSNRCARLATTAATAA